MKLEEYLKEIFNEEINISNYKKMDELPLFLQNEYHLMVGRIHEHECIFLVLKSERISVEGIRKHFIKLREYGDFYPVLVVEQLRPAQRKKLVAERLAFVEPGHQIYLPFICLAFDERVVLKERIKEKFTPAIQCVFIAILLQDEKEIDLKKLISHLELSQITVNRAIRQLADLGIIEITGNATRKQYTRINRKEFWGNGKDYLKTPVAFIIYTKRSIDEKDMYFTNDSAMARLSMINDASQPIYAMSKKKKEDIPEDLLLHEYELDQMDYCKIEVWKYDPGLFAKTNIVDIFSLYAEYVEENDPRVEIEFKELLEEELCRD